MPNLIPTQPEHSIQDPSKVSDFMLCPRYYFYRHILGWTNDLPNVHLIFGEAWHRGLAHILRSGDYSLKTAQEAFELHFMPFYEEHYPNRETDEARAPKTPGKALEAFVNYVAAHRADADNFRVLHTEIAGAVTLQAEPLLLLHFRMDSIIEDLKKNLFFSLEHKTASRISQGSLDDFLLSPQIGAYHYALCCYVPADKVYGVIVNITALYKSNVPRFERVNCRRGEDDTIVWLEMMLYYLKQLQIERDVLSIELARTEDVSYDRTMLSFPMRPNACTKWGITCTYHPFCVAWHNPLKKLSAYAEAPPAGMKREFWDPRTLEKDAKATLDGSEIKTKEA